MLQGKHLHSMVTNHIKTEDARKQTSFRASTIHSKLFKFNSVLLVSLHEGYKLLHAFSGDIMLD